MQNEGLFFRQGFVLLKPGHNIPFDFHHTVPVKLSIIVESKDFFPRILIKFSSPLEECAE
jgi:hypothetical protein